MRAILAKNTGIARHEKRAIATILLRQFVVTIAIAVIMLITRNRVAAVSAVWGGLLVCLPNLIFAINLFLCKSYRDPKKIVNAFYIGEIIKIMVTILFFITILRFYAIMLAPLLLGMMSCYLVYLTRG